MDHAVNWKDLPVRLEAPLTLPGLVQIECQIGVITADVMCHLWLQDGVQQHVLQGGDGHGQRDLGPLQSSSLQQGLKLETQEYSFGCKFESHSVHFFNQIRFLAVNDMCRTVRFSGVGYNKCSFFQV